MTHAYSELYLDDAQHVMAAMFDYAVKCLNYELSFFYNMFMQSSFCRKFEVGDAHVLAGMSGVEMPIDHICNMYSPYHEMHITQFVAKVEEQRQKYRCMTYLKKLRQRAGLSQRELAQLADIPLKTLQQYEQRQKNINKAQAEYVIRLSCALNCRPQDIMEE